MKHRSGCKFNTINPYLNNAHPNTPTTIINSSVHAVSWKISQGEICPRIRDDCFPVISIWQLMFVMEYIS